MTKIESLFMEEGGAPCNITKSTQDCLLQNLTKKLLRPRQSPDTNSIEHLWAILEREIQKMNKKPSSKADHLRLLHETLQKISQDTVRGLIKSMPKNTKGMSTKY